MQVLPIKSVTGRQISINDLARVECAIKRHSRPNLHTLHTYHFQIMFIVFSLACGELVDQQHLTLRSISHLPSAMCTELTVCREQV